nr:MAG TPA: hypothetical protein [Caudoviricetes sp.]
MHFIITTITNLNYLITIIVLYIYISRGYFYIISSFLYLKRRNIFMTYNMLLKQILSGKYVQEDMLNKLDTFYANNRITQSQYMELLEMVLDAE